MDKVLPGVSRSAMAFIVEHWLPLLKISALPLTIILAVAFYQLQGMGTMMQFIVMQSQQGDKMDPAAVSQMISALTPIYAAGLLSVFAFVWMFVRIVRFWKNGVGSLLGLTSGEVGATFMTLVYGLGIMLLTLLVYFAGAFALALIVGLGATILGNSALAIAGSILAVFVGILAMFGLIVFMYRFFVGLPGVALGEVPGFFSDIWPLAKGESYGIPLRLVLWSAVAMIPIFIIGSMFSYPLFSEIAEQLKTQPTLSPDMIAHIMKTMAPLQVVNLILQTPLIWLTTILLTDAHFRFRKKLSG